MASDATPNPKAVLKVFNNETEKEFTISARAFLEMMDDTYGDPSKPKKKYKVLEGTPLVKPQKAKNG